MTLQTGNAIYTRQAGPVAEFEVNRNCGVLSTKDTEGVPMHIETRDAQSDVSIAGTVTQELIDAGVKVISGIGGPTTLVANVTKPISANVILGSYGGFNQSLVGCTPAQRADASITKSPTPTAAPGSCWDHKGLFFRLNPTSRDWGRVLASRAHALVPGTTQVGHIVQTDTPLTNEATFGVKARFNELGVTNANIVTANVTGLPPVATLETALMQASANNPQVIIFALSAPSIPNLGVAFVNLRDTPSKWTAAAVTKPAGFDSIVLVGMQAPVSVDITAVPATVTTFLSGSQFHCIGPGGPLVGEPGNDYFDGVRAEYDPTQTDRFILINRNFDFLLLFSLAMTKAQTSEDTTAIAQAVRDIANPPGNVVYTYKDALDAINNGEDIDYEGSIGPLNFNDSNDLEQPRWFFYKILADGTINPNTEVAAQ